MSQVLVAYASKHGSTVGIATAIAETLNARGLRATCTDADAVKDLEPYDAVILGSAVYARRWRAEARHFLRRFRHELAERPFWIFSSGPVGDPAKDDAKWMEPAGVLAKAEALGMRGHVVFGGSVPAEPHGMMMRSMAQNTPEEFRDRRDWVAIREWAEAVADTLHVPA
jgi:menaquinone-dependent protoporphyrinogen oxidase